MGSLVDFSAAITQNGAQHALNLLAEDQNKIERLPFTIRIASSEEDMAKVVSIRHAGYARHLPHLANQLSVPERIDFDIGVSVLLAESKLDGRPLGTMRLQTNHFQPLALESSVTLPSRFDGLVLAEATRLAATQEKVGRLVTTMIFKAYLMHCFNAGVDWMVITARSPMDRRYEALMMEDVFPGRGYIPMRHVGDIPHRVMALDLAMLQQRWEETSHPLYKLFFHTHHPDIDVGHANNLPPFLHELQYGTRQHGHGPYE